eukprot:TRINITY_DN81357_c0_g1_i1.p1 TRINITY_DN81357_c0_g1~~TRINITY_DN81357_c0_g1_i1.p1  ORF type:complete len:467 (-),score=90.16 TRINITY_DN81357_c0_g1_i1:37-1368(-)
MLDEVSPTSFDGCLSLAQAAACSGWPLDALEDRSKHPTIVDTAESFLSFVHYGDHSEAQICVLRDGIRKLDLADTLPASLIQACKEEKSAVEAVLMAIEGDAGGLQESLDGDVFTWPSEAVQGSARCIRDELKGGSLRSRLLRGRQVEASDGLVYMAELSRERKSPHRLTGERCRSLTSSDVRDVSLPGNPQGGEGSAEELPMWDRGHSFVGARGAGSCLHVDQAWWSNIAKNFLGYKLVALWGSKEAPKALKLTGQLFRRPLTEEQRCAILEASGLALLGPGDVACFTGGLPHATVVVGEDLNLTAYESLVNWHPKNAELLLRGAQRRPGRKGAMSRRPLHGLLDDICDVVQRRVGNTETGPEKCDETMIGATMPLVVSRDCTMARGLRHAFREALLKNRHCARQLAAREDEADDSPSSSQSRSATPEGRRETSPQKRPRTE